MLYHNDKIEVKTEAEKQIQIKLSQKDRLYWILFDDEGSIKSLLILWYRSGNYNGSSWPILLFGNLQIIIGYHWLIIIEKKQTLTAFCGWACRPHCKWSQDIIWCSLISNQINSILVFYKEVETSWTWIKTALLSNYCRLHSLTLPYPTAPKSIAALGD